MNTEASTSTPADPAAGEKSVPPGGPHRRRPAGVLTLVCAAVAVLLLAAAVAGQWVFPDWDEQDLLSTAALPGGDHLLGTDELGRDVLRMLVAGARSTLAGAALVAVGSMLLGNVLGLTAGYLGGAVDAVVRRLADLLLALPALLVTIVVAGIGGGGYALAVGVLVLLTSPGDIRLVRSAVLEQRHRAYVEAARTLGLSPVTIMVRHIWPNVLPVVLANMMLNFAGAVVALSSLSFLGLGVPPGAPDWGRMLAENRTLLYDNPSAVLAPAVAVIVSAVVVNLLGDRLFEYFSDRRS